MVEGGDLMEGVMVCVSLVFILSTCSAFLLFWSRISTLLLILARVQDRVV